MRKTVQIVGGGRSTEGVPASTEGVERWSLNDLAFKDKWPERFDGWTRWFDLHHTGHIIERRPHVYKWYQEQTKPIVLWAADPTIATSTAYPLVDVQRYFNVNSELERHFLSSFDYMMALAIYEDFEVIDIYGFRMLSPVYTFQLPSAMYWMGRARGMGLTVQVHGESALLPVNKMYGIETVDVNDFWTREEPSKEVLLDPDKMDALYDKD